MSLAHRNILKLSHVTSSTTNIMPFGIVHDSVGPIETMMVPQNSKPGVSVPECQESNSSEIGSNLQVDAPKKAINAKINEYEQSKKLNMNGVQANCIRTPSFAKSSNVFSILVDIKDLVQWWAAGRPLI